MTEHRLVTESSTPSLINENLTQPITAATEFLNKFEETTLELGSDENIINISQEESSSETSGETEVSEEDDEDDASAEETTQETNLIDTDEDDEETTVQIGKKK